MMEETRQYWRKFLIEERKAVNADTFDVSISSEKPVDMGYGNAEVLVHSPQAVDLSRGPSFPLLASHEHDQLNIGVADNVRVVGNKLRARLKFGKSKKAQEVLEDVKEGILRWISVGYQVLSRQKPRDGIVKVDKWKLLEVSIVSVAADTSVGFGRSWSMPKETRWEDLNLKTEPTERESVSRRIDTMMEREKRVNEYFKEGEFRSFGEFMTAVMKVGSHKSAGSYVAGEVDQRLQRAATGLEKDGFDVPVGFMDRLLFDGQAASPVLEKCSIFPVSTGQVTFPRVSETTRSDSQFGGVQTYWLEEAGEVTKSKPLIGTLNLSMKKLVSLCYVTDELLADSTLCEKFVFHVMRTGLRRKVESAIIRGSGGGEWLGILSASATVTVAKSGAQAGDSIVAENIGDMLSHFPPESWTSPGACWLCNPSAIADLSLLEFTAAGAAAAPMFTWRPAGKRFSQLAGFDLIPCESCSAVGDPGDIILADLTQYVIVQRAIKETVSGHVLFDSDQSAFRITYRADGQPSWSRPVVSEQGSVEMSPFIVLAERS